MMLYVNMSYDADPEIAKWLTRATSAARSRSGSSAIN